MPPKRRFITCEICKNRASRSNREKRMFMARFPLDEDRCKQWVKFVGKEDLIYVPIEKLHTLKYVCGNHFDKRAFNKKQNRLKKWAIPSKNLKADPLPDEMLNKCDMEIQVHVTFIQKLTLQRQTRLKGLLTMKLHYSRPDPVPQTHVQEHSSCWLMNQVTSKKFNHVKENSHLVSLTYPTLNLCKLVDSVTSCFEVQVKPILHERHISQQAVTMMLSKCDNLLWICDNHKDRLLQMLLVRLSNLLIRNECHQINLSFAKAEDSTADIIKRSQQQGVAK